MDRQLHIYKGMGYINVYLIGNELDRVYIMEKDLKDKFICDYLTYINNFCEKVTLYTIRFYKFAWLNHFYLHLPYF